MAITVASYLTPKGNNIQGKGIIPDKILDLPEAREYGNSEDKWVKNAEIYLNSMFDKSEVKETINQIEKNIIDN